LLRPLVRDKPRSRRHENRRRTVRAVHNHQERRRRASPNRKSWDDNRRNWSWGTAQPRNSDWSTKTEAAP